MALSRHLGLRLCARLPDFFLLLLFRGELMLLCPWEVGSVAMGTERPGPPWNSGFGARDFGSGRGAEGWPLRERGGRGSAGCRVGSRADPRGCGWSWTGTRPSRFKDRGSCLMSSKTYWEKTPHRQRGAQKSWTRSGLGSSRGLSSRVLLGSTKKLNWARPAILALSYTGMSTFVAEW